METEGYSMEQILPKNAAIRVGKTANLHTGGTIHDVAAILHPKLIEAAVIGAQALDIPVVFRPPGTSRKWGGICDN